MMANPNLGDQQIPVSLSQGFLLFDKTERLVSCSPFAVRLLELSAELTRPGTPYAEIAGRLDQSSRLGPVLPPDAVDADPGSSGRADCAVSGQPGHAAFFWARIPLPNFGFGIAITAGTHKPDRRSERRLYQSLAQSIAAADSFDAAIEATLRFLCRHGGWRYGELWIPNGTGALLKAGRNWASEPNLAADLDPRRHGREVLRPGEDFAGSIWQTGRGAVISDLRVAKDSDYGRRRVALGAGLPAVLGAPLMLGDKVFGICLFNAPTITPRAERMLRFLVAVSPQLHALFRVKAADATAAIHRRRVSELLASMGEAIITVDANQIITGFNREAERLCGYPADEALGQPLDILLPKESIMAHRTLVGAFGRSGDIRRVMGGRPAIRGRRKDGSEFVAEASISKLEADGETTFTAILRDVTELRRTEAALRKSEKRFRDVAEVASDLIWELDSQLRFTYMSGGKHGEGCKSAGNVLGKTPWEATGADPATDELWIRCRADLEARRSFRNFAYSVTPRNGQTRYYRVSGVPSFDENGDFAGYHGITTDETDTMSALLRAQQVEELLRSAVNSISEGFIIFDKDDRLVMCNQTYRDLFPESEGLITPNTTFEDITRNALQRGFYEHVTGREEAWIQKRIRHHREASGSIEQWRADGKVYLVTDRHMPDGGTAGLRMDITALKHAEAALRESERRLHTTFETISEGVVVIDSKLQVIAFNKQLFTLLGVNHGALETGDAAEKLVRLCFTTLNADEEAVEHCVQQELSRLREFKSRVVERSFRSGCVLEINDNPLPGGGLVRTYRDITVHKKVQSELRAAALQAQQASAAKSEFMASVSHELRTPLNAIIGFSEVMKEGMFGALGNEHYQGYAQDINRSGRHLLAIINNILDFTKVESGREALKEAEVDVPCLLDEVLDTVHLQADEGGVALLVDASQPRIRLRADATKFKQILINLLSNAIKFTNPGGRVLIDYGPDAKDGFVLRVVDTGIGMTPEEIPIALEPFRQLDGGLNRRYAGTGLGLPLTKRLIELHGGSLTIGSSPGQGTEVTISFPAERVVAISQPVPLSNVEHTANGDRRLAI